MRFIDDLGFDDEVSLQFGSFESERTARMAELWKKQARQRHAQEAAAMNDLRTTRLVKLLNIANTLTRLNGEINGLILSAENDEGALIMLQNQLTHAEERAGHIHDEYAKRLGVHHG